MQGFLLDTNVLSEAAKAKPSNKVEAFLARPDEMWLSVVSLHEFAFGLTRLADVRRRVRLEGWLDSVKKAYDDRLIPVDAKIAETAGRIRGASALTGRIVEPIDSVLAATAIIRALTLATRNTRDFEHLNLEIFNPWES